ncbi:hypothetical protein CKA32_003567 [Geitlerinema sp. FC II]|nr:hypothetical protein CKA32_003567 [Geitlerinema sp. FC II]
MAEGSRTRAVLPPTRQHLGFFFATFDLKEQEAQSQPQ